MGLVAKADVGLMNGLPDTGGCCVAGETGSEEDVTSR